MRLEEKETEKYLGFLEAYLFKQAEIKGKMRKLLGTKLDILLMWKTPGQHPLEDTQNYS